MSLVTPKHVLWFIPNQIGYMRVITAIISFVTMPSYPKLTTLIYGTSCLLDALDGTMARKYNQVSKFGAVLDMVTDRSTTSSLICYLCIAYPSLSVIFQLLLSLDLSSHYMHMYATLSDGASSHKNIGKESSKLLHFYYTRRDVLFMICAFNELLYMGLYLFGFQSTKTFGTILIVTCLPGFIFKQIANVIQLNRAAMILATIDASDANERQNKDKTETKPKK
ncbi:hypothetical protein Kpol_359p14 [Vanderwaltozyma polyspora DSM 70294]|uniref:CDP-diacylglycerol--inositol 3-phosphatidyltransferase n=1 Tax=Vanderwaltozyma polyspora (strain ATCC 22028 / DSM 70294 / BCRC 21397 / CBS 2163 / NBRC 10782 / NRRL Y-8283 / UCD 57-17) TaxID=436907 RepID=A7TSB6_VANPO|nr:uncharacterized protein Kpol_359p14 [Vanderwaltozyma polyspora DSM 70294]EDO14853.1 hypothetical protein Kpol_359p14 [Vanderwaltozyma polyspora DSM 70294]